MLNRRTASALVLFVALLAPSLHASLTISPITWNIVGLDSNSPASGPNRFPVGARVCSDDATTNVDVDFLWDSANANIDLRTGMDGMVMLLKESARATARTLTSRSKSYRPPPRSTRSAAITSPRPISRARYRRQRRASSTSSTSSRKAATPSPM